MTVEEEGDLSTKYYRLKDSRVTYNTRYYFVKDACFECLPWKGSANYTLLAYKCSDIIPGRRLANFQYYSGYGRPNSRTKRINMRLYDFLESYTDLPNHISKKKYKFFLVNDFVLRENFQQLDGLEIFLKEIF